MSFQKLLEQYTFKLTWQNELGSIMEVTYGSDGSMTGTYQSGVGNDKKFVLAGRWDTRGSQNFSSACGWSVVWRNPSVDLDEVTSWSGHHVFDKKAGQFVIKTTWLLTQDVVLANDWKSTLIGQDTFTIK